MCRATNKSHRILRYITLTCDVFSHVLFYHQVDSIQRFFLVVFLEKSRKGLQVLRSMLTTNKCSAIGVAAQKYMFSEEQNEILKNAQQYNLR